MLYLETSWTPVHQIKWLVNSLGADKIIMGSDLPDNLPVELAKYQAIDLTKIQLESVFYKTAISVFSKITVKEDI